MKNEVIEKIHWLIHDIDVLLANGNISAARKLILEIDLLTHDNINS